MILCSWHPREPHQAATRGLVLVVRSNSISLSRFLGHRNGFRPPPIPSRQVHYLRLFTRVRGETVWKVGGGFLIACVSCFKRAGWDIFALFWLLSILLIEAYWDFPDSLGRCILRSAPNPSSPKFAYGILHNLDPIEPRKGR